MISRFFTKIGLYFLKRGGAEMYMVPIFIALIQYDPEFTFDEVSDSLKDVVKEKLALLGLGTDGKPLRK